MAADFPVVKLVGTKKTVLIGARKTPVLIGERINPTGRKKLTEAIKAGDFDYIRNEAKAQIAAGADCLDVNMGVPDTDEKANMIAAIKAVQEVADVPLVIDSSNPEVIKAGLEVVKGRPMINSTTGEEKRLITVLPLAKEYDVAVLGLTLDDAGIPAQAEKRIAVANKIYERAKKIGLQNDQLLIDPLALACATNQEGGKASLDTIGYVRNTLKLNTSIGLSNISFGMPERPQLNAAFLLLCVGQGLTSFIGNPMDKDIQFALKSVSLMWGEDRFGMGYVKHCKLIMADQPKK
ncbi:MAG: dihydropteroate synthase [Thermoplasmata archaeon]|nr:dihydropteroate synthase [Thermoplasmata archaeon]